MFYPERPKKTGGVFSGLFIFQTVSLLLAQSHTEKPFFS